MKKGLNPSSADQIFFSGELMMPAVKIGLVTGLVALTEGLAIGRTFATLREYRVDGNKEMMSFGFMNIFGSFFSCFVSTGNSPYSLHATSACLFCNSKFEIIGVPQ